MLALRALAAWARWLGTVLCQRLQRAPNLVNSVWRQFANSTSSSSNLKYRAQWELGPTSIGKPIWNIASTCRKSILSITFTWRLRARAIFHALIAAVLVERKPKSKSSASSSGSRWFARLREISRPVASWLHAALPILDGKSSRRVTSGMSLGEPLTMFGE